MGETFRYDQEHLIENSEIRGVISGCSSTLHVTGLRRQYGDSPTRRV